MIFNVIDLETTSLKPSLGMIVEIGICLVNTEKGITRLFDEVVNEGPSFDEGAWVFTNTTLTPSEVRLGLKNHEWIPRVQAILDNHPVTAWNNPFDYGFMESAGLVFDKMPDPMRQCTELIGLRGHHGGGYKWPRVEEAWEYFFPDKPYVEKHRAFDDCLHESILILKMIQENAYEPRGAFQ